MRRTPWRFHVLAGVFLACLVRPAQGSEPTGSAPASAEARSVTERASLAREQGHLGLAAYAERRWRDALQHFTEAEAWMHSPVFVLYMARCQQELGAAEQARELYRRAAEQPLDEESPTAWQEAQVSAREALQALETAEHRGSEVPAPSDRTVVEHGSTQGAPKHEEALRAPPTRPFVPVTLAEEMPPYRYGAYTALGVGVIGLAVGTVAGSLAWSRAADIKSRCDGTSCLASDEAKVHDVRRLAHVATVGFVVAATGAAAGVTLWLLPAASERNIAVRVQPAAASITGRF